MIPRGSHFGVNLKIVCSYISDYSPKWIASLGQTPAQEPHSIQVSGSMLYLSPSEIASTGHTGAQVPQATQLSLIT